MALARSVDPDVARIRDRMASSPVTDSVATFVPGPGIERLDLQFDLVKMRRNHCILRAVLHLQALSCERDPVLTSLPVAQRDSAENANAVNTRREKWRTACLLAREGCRGTAPRHREPPPPAFILARARPSRALRAVRDPLLER